MAVESTLSTVEVEGLELLSGKSNAISSSEEVCEKSTRYLVTATPPTPNGNLHVGHVAGPYLAADVFTRGLRLQGHSARYLCGADDHQSYVVVKAKTFETTPEELADGFASNIQETLKKAEIQLDHFGLPRSSSHHRSMVQRVFRSLYERGFIVAKEAPTPYCPQCDLFLFEAHIQGDCPHCGAGSGGNACEECGRPNDCANLENASCIHCGSEPELQMVKRLYFPLEPLRAELEDFFRSVSMSSHMHALCSSMLEEKLPDIAVSHVASWGIPVPIKGFEGQRIYVWFEMGPGYLAATQDLQEGLSPNAQGERGEAWRQAWTGPNREVVQFFGFDNGYFHALLFPATFIALGEGLRLPSAFVTNEFFRYEGKKFSTSRNHAMWANELFERVPTDMARFGLAYDGPETRQSNFTFEGLREIVHRELVEGWSPWLVGLGERVERWLGGRAPEIEAILPVHVSFRKEIDALARSGIAALGKDDFSMQRLTRVLCEMVRLSRRFADGQSHWGITARCAEHRRTGLGLELFAARLLAIVSAPIMPGFSEQLWGALGHEGSPLDAGWNLEEQALPPGQEIDLPTEPWFQPIAALESSSS